MILMIDDGNMNKTHPRTGTPEDAKEKGEVQQQNYFGIAQVDKAIYQADNDDHTDPVDA